MHLVAMVIEHEMDDGRSRYTLSDADTAVNVEIVPDNAPVMHVESEDIDFMELAQQRAGNAEPTVDELLGALTVHLDFVLEQVVVDTVSENRITFALSDNSVLIAGERWTDQPTRLYPRNT